MDGILKVISMLGDTIADLQRQLEEARQVIRALQMELEVKRADEAEK